jgi:putative nucleotidyltransferase with HDIG domain
VAETQRAERLIISLRWLVLAAAALMVEEVASGPALLLGAGVVAMYNLAAYRVVTQPSLFHRWGNAAGIGTRIGDLAAASLVVWSVPNWPSGAYLLLLFPLLSTAYVYGRSVGTVAIMGTAVAVNLAAVLSQRGWGEGTSSTLEGTLGQTGLLAASGLVGLALRSYRTNERVQEDQGEKLSGLVELKDLPAVTDPEEALNRIAEMALRCAGAEQVGVLLKAIDDHGLRVWATASVGGTPCAIAADDPIATLVAASGRALNVVPGVVARTASERRRLQSEDIAKPSACVPLRHRSATSSKHVGEVLGVLLARGKIHGSRFTDTDLSVLRSLAAGAALVYLNTTLYDRLYEAFVGTLRSLAKGLEARDPYTQGHSERVAAIAATLARKMGLDEQAVGMLREAALLHDIGKVGIPDGVLRKPGSLTEGEWESIKHHPVMSAEICGPLDMPPEVLFIIRHHQERLDGSGYPDGLQRHQQPLPLRIVSVADAFDAMSSDRPYRQALTAESRLRELNRLAGIEYDQQVVEALKSLIEQGAFQDLYPADNEVESSVARS